MFGKFRTSPGLPEPRFSPLVNTDHRALFGLTRHASRHELRRLIEQGFLRLEGEGRGAGYRALHLLEVGVK